MRCIHYTTTHVYTVVQRSEQIWDMTLRLWVEMRRKGQSHISPLCHRWQRIRFSFCRIITTSKLQVCIFKPHRMHEMRTIATDVPVAWCACQYVTHVCSAKTTERIEILFRWNPKHTNPLAVKGGKKKILPIVKYRNIARLRCGVRLVTLVSYVYLFTVEQWNKAVDNILAVQLPVVPVHCWPDGAHLSVHDCLLALQTILIVSCETATMCVPWGAGGYAQPNTGYSTPCTRINDVTNPVASYNSDDTPADREVQQSMLSVKRERESSFTTRVSCRLRIPTRI